MMSEERFYYFFEEDCILATFDDDEVGFWTKSEEILWFGDHIMSIEVVGDIKR